MSIIFSEDINDNRGEDLNKRVDTIYDYIAYMKEQLEFWARNRTREISDADKKIAAANEDIGTNAEEIEAVNGNVSNLAERVTTLEGRDLITHEQVVPSNGTTHIENVYPDAITGYTFVCWIGVTSNGWIGTPYLNQYDDNPTMIWDLNYHAAGDAYYYTLCALYKKN